MKEKELTAYLLCRKATKGEDAAYELCRQVDFQPFGKVSVRVIGVSRLPVDLTEALLCLMLGPEQADMLCKLVNTIVSPEEAFSVCSVTEVLSDG